MIEIGNGIKLFKHRRFAEWHSPFKPQEHVGGCPNGNCPWEDHHPYNSEHDPLSVNELLALQPGTRMLILADYCERWYVSFLTLDSIFEPQGTTQFRFKEKSRHCWYFKPVSWGSIGQMLYLDSIRYLATVESEAPAFGKDGKLPCFMRELARIGNLSLAEVKKGIQRLEDSILKAPPITIKPWQSQARDLWKSFCGGDKAQLLSSLKHLFSFRQGRYPAAILFVVAAQQGRLKELSNMMGTADPSVVSIPANFGDAIDYCIQKLSGHYEGVKDWAGGWKKDFVSMFGINMGHPTNDEACVGP